MRNKTFWEHYGDWLIKRIGFRDRNYIPLLRILHDIPFRWIILKDRNRASDGVYRRREFFVEMGVLEGKFDQECSVLEMLVSLAIRIDEEFTGNPGDPAADELLFEFIKNLGLVEIDVKNVGKITNIVEKWLDRDMDFDGNGGILPLRHASKDQRHTEIWDQMMEYIDENWV